jgi:hypothetical protein
MFRVFSSFWQDINHLFPFSLSARLALKRMLSTSESMVGDDEREHFNTRPYKIERRYVVPSAPLLLLDQLLD